jgi:hypothetical protein
VASRRHAKASTWDIGLRLSERTYNDGFEGRHFARLRCAVRLVVVMESSMRCEFQVAQTKRIQYSSLWCTDLFSVTFLSHCPTPSPCQSPLSCMPPTIHKSAHINFLASVLEAMFQHKERILRWRVVAAFGAASAQTVLLDSIHCNKEDRQLAQIAAHTLQ